jgi:hypothetical protein
MARAGLSSSAVLLHIGQIVAAPARSRDRSAPSAPNALPHNELRMQRTGRLDAFEDVDHVMRGHTKRVQPGDHL